MSPLVRVKCRVWARARVGVRVRVVSVVALYGHG